MALDRESEALVREWEALGSKPVAELTPADIRLGLARLAEMAGSREPVAVVEDRNIPGPAGSIPVRIYRPEADGLLPVLLYLHGGGWVGGGLATGDVLCCRLANEARAIVVSVDYRLAPEHPYPAGVEDADSALRWVAENAQEFGGDPGRLAVAGESAGGNLAAVVARRARDRGGPPLRIQVLVYPALDHRFDTPSYLENAEGYLLTREKIIWYWQKYLGDERHGDEPDASPLRVNDLRGLAPALVITAEHDPLRDEGEAYAQRLEEAGVPVTLVRYPGTIHVFVMLANRLEQGRRAVARIADELNRAFAG